MDAERLHREATDACSAPHARCRKFMSAAASLLGDSTRIAQDCTDVPKVIRTAERIADREFAGLHPGRGKEKRRFLSAITPEGPVIFHQTLQTLCSRIYAIEDEYGAASRLLLAELRGRALAAGLERQSEHPLAQAVLECAARRGVQPYEVTDFKAVFGKGIEGRYAQELYFAGNEAMLAERGMALPAPVKQKLDALAGEGKTPLLFCGEKTVLGVIAVADTVKPSSAAAIADLKRMGIDVTMLTGDNRRTAEAIRRQLDIPHVIAEVLPQEKEQHVAALQQQGKTVAMVGDGINDAPALARADVGIAIGAGTDVAIESADVVLMKSDLADAVTAIRLSKAVIRNIKENLFWAFFYNTVGIPVAAGLLYLPFHLRLNPMIGAAAMSLSSVCVVMNALRLKRFKAHPAHAAAEQGAPLSPMSAQPRAERIELPQNENINKNDREEKQMKTITLIIEGMMCQNCRSHVDKALNGISGVAANVSLEEKKAVCTVEDGVSADTLKAAVEDAGYTVISVE